MADVTAMHPPLFQNQHPQTMTVTFAPHACGATAMLTGATAQKAACAAHTPALLTTPAASKEGGRGGRWTGPQDVIVSWGIAHAGGLTGRRGG